MANQERSGGHEDVEGVNITNPTGDFSPGYRKSDMERIFHDAKPNSWQDLVNYIDQKGDSQWHITPGEAVSMRDDIKQLMKHNVPFTNNPDKAYEEARKYRGQDRGKEEPKLREEGR